MPTQRPTSCSAASVRSSPAAARRLISATFGSRPRSGERSEVALVGGHARSAGSGRSRSPSSRAAAAAPAAAAVDEHVPELAGEAEPALVGAAVGDDAATDADLAVDDEDVAAVRVAGRGLGNGGEVGLVGHLDEVGGVAQPLAQQRGEGHVLPSEVGGDRHRAGVVVDQAGDPDDDGHRDGAELGDVGQGAVEELDQPVDDLVGTQAAGVDGGAPLATVSPARSTARVVTWWTLISAPTPNAPAPLISTIVPGRPTAPRSALPSRTRPRSISSPTRLDTVALLSPRSRGQPGPRPGAAVPQAAQHEGEVGAAHGALVGAPGAGAEPAAPVPATSGPRPRSVWSACRRSDARHHLV